MGDFKDWLLVILGNIFIVILAVRMIGAWMKREYGDMMTNAVLGLIVAYIVYDSDGAVGLMKRLAGMIFGNLF
ncbi:hypothetical protein [Rothia uropygialis]|uniref:hypothetical protein n=1 Tax=Kocuria sp. 36 TaxID=1415402 RepID=UPI00101D1753|nr:hypothetical protein [Kocuria sp. 36]